MLQLEDTQRFFVRKKKQKFMGTVGYYPPRYASFTLGLSNSS